MNSTSLAGCAIGNQSKVQSPVSLNEHPMKDLKEEFVEPFDYSVEPVDAVAEPLLWSEIAPPEEGSSYRGLGDCLPQKRSADDRQSNSQPGPCQEEYQRRLELERKAGYQEGREAERAASMREQASMRSEVPEQTAAWLRRLNEEAERYWNGLDEEVAKLAMQVVQKILKRQLQVDPVLLSSVVRTALGQLPMNADVKLSVPSEDVDLWKETFDHLSNLSIHPTVCPSGELKRGEVRIESALGTADLGCETQRATIERAIFGNHGRSSTDLNSAMAPRGE